MSRVELAITTGLVFSGIALVMGAWVTFYEEAPPVEYLGKSYAIPDVVEPGGTIELFRTIVVKKKTLLMIYRTAQTEVGGQLMMYDLPIATSNKEPGTYKQFRLTQLPKDMVEGGYTLVTKVCWKPNMLKTQCRDVPDVYFRVQK